MSCPKEKIMKHALIGGLSVLATIVGIEAANAQADINPNLYPVYRGAPVAEQPWEWHATPGPMRPGNQGPGDVHPRPRHGYLNNCPPPTPSAPPHPPTRA